MSQKSVSMSFKKSSFISDKGRNGFFLAQYELSKNCDFDEISESKINVPIEPTMVKKGKNLKGK